MAQESYCCYVLHSIGVYPRKIAYGSTRVSQGMAPEADNICPERGETLDCTAGSTFALTLRSALGGPCLTGHNFCHSAFLPPLGPQHRTTRTPPRRSGKGYQSAGPPSPLANPVLRGTRWSSRTPHGGLASSGLLCVWRLNFLVAHCFCTSRCDHGSGGLFSRHCLFKRIGPVWGRYVALWVSLKAGLCQLPEVVGALSWVAAPFQTRLT